MAFCLCASSSATAADEPEAKQPSKVPMAPSPTTVYIVYYSTYGHIRTLAQAMKEGAESVQGVTASLFQVPETLPEEVLKMMHAPPKSADPVIDVADLPKADGFCFGVPTRFGSPAAQFKAMWDATGGHWKSGALQGKPFSMFTSTGTPNGGQESTIMNSLSNFVHQGMIYVAPGYLTPSLQFDMGSHGGSPWGPATLAGADGSRQVSEGELEFAKAAGAKLAAVAQKLKST